MEYLDTRDQTRNHKQITSKVQGKGLDDLVLDTLTPGP